MNSAPSNSDGLVLRMDFDAVNNGRVQERVSGTSVPVLRDLAGLAGVIEGRLNVPGDTRSYSFTIDERTLVAFDALHDNAGMTVTLTGPGGGKEVRTMRNGERQQTAAAASYLLPGPSTNTVAGHGSPPATNTSN